MWSNTNYINIEIFSGKINIETNRTCDEYYENENKKLFIFESTDDFIISIEALENSFYVIHESFFNINYYKYVEPGSNYLTYIKNNIVFEPKDNFGFIGKENSYYFTQINPINCKINFIATKNFISREELYIIDEKNGFYQETKKQSQRYDYEVIPKDKPCLLFICSYLYHNKDPIMLANNVSQSFLFNETYNTLSFAFPHIHKNDDVNINLYLFNEENYKLYLYINNKKYREYNLNS